MKKSTTSILLWALLPILCIGLAIALPKWYCEQSETSYNDDYAKISWESHILNSPDVIFQYPDSIKQFGYQFRQQLKADTATAADITHLFPEFKMAKKLYIIKSQSKKKYLIWSKNYEINTFDSLTRLSDGRFALYSSTAKSPEFVPLGRFAGQSTYTSPSAISLGLTTLNSCALVALLFCIVGIIFIFASDTKPDKETLMYFPWIACFIPLVLSVHYFWGWWDFSISLNDIPEWITLLWLLAEAGLLSGLLYYFAPVEHVQQQSASTPAPVPLTTEEELSIYDKWYCVTKNGDDSEDWLIINNDGTLIYSCGSVVKRMNYLENSDGSLLVNPNDSEPSLLDYDEKYGSTPSNPLVEIYFDGKVFTCDGEDLQSAIQQYEIQCKAKRDADERERAYKDAKAKVIGNFNEPIKFLLYVAPVGTIILLAVLIGAIVKSGLQSGAVYAVSFYLLISLGVSIYQIRNYIKTKRFEIFRDSFYSVYPKLKGESLVNYLKAVVKNKNLTLSEWEKMQNDKK